MATADGLGSFRAVQVRREVVGHRPPNSETSPSPPCRVVVTLASPRVATIARVVRALTASTRVITARVGRLPPVAAARLAELDIHGAATRGALARPVPVVGGPVASHRRPPPHATRVREAVPVCPAPATTRTLRGHTSIVRHGRRGKAAPKAATGLCHFPDSHTAKAAATTNSTLVLS